MTTVSITIPGMRVASLNVREHWARRARRCSVQKAAVILALRGTVPTATLKALRAAPRVNVRLVRLGGRKLDRDNLAGAFKPVLDGVCQWLAVDDGDEERLGIEWRQEPGGDYGVRVEIAAAAA